MLFLHLGDVKGFDVLFMHIAAERVWSLHRKTRSAFVVR